MHFLFFFLFFLFNESWKMEKPRGCQLKNCEKCIILYQTRVAQAVNSPVFRNKKNKKRGHIILCNCLHGPQERTAKVKFCWLTNTLLTGLTLMLTGKETKLLSVLCSFHGWNVVSSLLSWCLYTGQMRTETKKWRAASKPEKNELLNACKHN